MAYETNDEKVIEFFNKIQNNRILEEQLIMILKGMIDTHEVLLNDDFLDYILFELEIRDKNRIKMNPSDPDYQYICGHHLWPKKMGGPNISENLFNHTFSEHLEAHKRLTKFTIDQSLVKMSYTYRMMCNFSGGEEKDSNEFQLSATIAAIESSKRMEGNELWRFVDPENLRKAIVAFNESDEGKRINIEKGKRQSDFYKTEDGQKLLKQIGQSLKDFYQTEDGKEIKKAQTAHRKEFFETEEGKKFLDDLSKKLVAFYQTEEGKKIAGERGVALHNHAVEGTHQAQTDSARRTISEAAKKSITKRKLEGTLFKPETIKKLSEKTKRQYLIQYPNGIEETRIGLQDIIDHFGDQSAILKSIRGGKVITEGKLKGFQFSYKENRINIKTYEVTFRDHHIEIFKGRKAIAEKFNLELDSISYCLRKYENQIIPYGPLIGISVNV